MNIEEFIRRGYEGEGVLPSDIRPLDDGTYVMARRLMFHWMVIRGYQDDYTGYFDRWCYATEELARTALASFPQEGADGFEPAGWHRHPPTARRRPNGDPALEYIEK